MSSARSILSVFGLLLSGACTVYVPTPVRGGEGATGDGGTEPAPGATGGSGGTTPVLSGLDAGVASADAAPVGVPPDACTDASKLVYVVSRTNDLYGLRPDTVTFTHVGTLACPAQVGAFPFSMAVDRSGTAWVLYTDGNLFAVSTKDASCKPTTFTPNQAGFSLFGMGFVSDGPGASTDTLYVSENVNGGGLGKIDLGTLALTRVAPYGGALVGQKAELTGNGNGDLFGFFLTTPAQVAQIAKTSGAIDVASPLATVTVGTDWAFSYWGGDFYLYTGNSTDPSQHGSTVTRYRPSDGSVTVLSTGVGFFIEGAGVSTCAPTTPPPAPPPPPPAPAH